MLPLEQLLKTENVMFVMAYGVKQQKERSGVNVRNVQLGFIRIVHFKILMKQYLIYVTSDSVLEYIILGVEYILL